MDVAPTKNFSEPSIYKKVTSTVKEFGSGVDHCLIFNYQEFDYENSRPGSEKDVESLKNYFEKLEFTIHLCENFTSKQTRDVLKRVSKMIDSNSSCFVCCILSHGNNKGEIYTRDNYLSVHEYFKPFIPWNENCNHALKGKPKIFFIQSCRGTQADCGLKLDMADSAGITRVSFKPHCAVIPHHADFLVMYSTFPDHFAFRNAEGSWFIQELHQCLNNNPELDLVHVLTLVIFYVVFGRVTQSKEKMYNDKKQTPCLVSTLQNKVYFVKKQENGISTSCCYKSSTDSTDGLKIWKKFKSCLLGQEATVVDAEVVKLNTPLSELEYRIKDSKSVQCTFFVNQKYKHVAVPGSSNAVYKIRNHFYELRFHVDSGFWEDDDPLGKMTIHAKSEFTNIDCFICLVATLGRNYYLISNRKDYLRPDVYMRFAGAACKSLVSKPKVFIFLVCGDIMQALISSDKARKKKISSHADLLIFEVFIDYENYEIGSYIFAEIFCDVLKQHSAEMDFIEMMTLTNHRFMQKCEAENIKNPKPFITMTSTLTRNLVFPKAT